MDGETRNPENHGEKGWFVFAADQQEGPYTLGDIRERVRLGALSSRDFVWKSGMNDWQIIDENDAFQESSAPEPATLPSAPVSAAPSAPPFYYVARELPWKPRAPVAPAPVAVLPSENKASYIPASRSTVILLSLTLLGVLLTSYFMFRLHSLHRIPELPDVFRDEYQVLRATAQQPLSSSGPAVAIAVQKTAALTPAFYLATNLPDGAEFEVRLEGVPNTLLGQFHYSRSVRVKVRQGIARTPAFHQKDGGLLPRGEYRVQVSDPAIGGKIQAERAYFLGGPRDAAFTRDLNAFHQIAREQAVGELTELKELSATLESQLRQCMLSFENLVRARSGNRAKALSIWTRSSHEWELLESQVTTLLNQMDPDLHYHDELYRLAREIGSRLDQLHAAEKALAGEGTPDSARIDSIAQAESVLQSSLLTLNSRIQVAPIPEN